MLEPGPAATLAAVSLALARSKMFLRSSWVYFIPPAKSAWPVLGIVTFPSLPRRLSSAIWAVSSPGSWGSITFCHLSQSLLGIRRAMGLPRLTPARTPERIVTWSRSIFILPPRPAPHCLLESCLFTSSKEMGRPLGNPSTMVTSPLPWDSPAVRKRNLN